MNAEQIAVAEFMKAFDQKCRSKPFIPDKDETRLRVSLISEEFEELKKAFEFQSLIGIGDALADLLYVVYGTAVTCGMDAQQLFSEVHRSNMSKFWLSSEVANLMQKDAQETYQYNSQTPLTHEDGTTARKISQNRWVVKNKEGKILKSPSYSEANIGMIVGRL